MTHTPELDTHKGSWTPEPWNVSPHIGLARPTMFIEKNNNKVIGECLICKAFTDEDHNQVEAMRPKEEAEANAARIVACVNACAGLNPAAYRACVEALKLALTRLEAETENDGTLHAIQKAITALAQSEEKG